MRLGGATASSKRTGSSIPKVMLGVIPGIPAPGSTVTHTTSGLRIPLKRPGVYSYPRHSCPPLPLFSWLFTPYSPQKTANLFPPQIGTENSCAQSLCNLIRFAIRLDYLIECGVVSALVRLADPGDEATSECCAAALYLFFCHPAVLALIDGHEVKEVPRVSIRFCPCGGRGDSWS